MKKLAIVVLAAHILGACLPFGTPTPGPAGPTVDVAGTVQAGAQTSVAQTLTALPTITVAPVTDTATPPIAVPTDTATSVPSTATLVPNLTTTPVTATVVPAITSTATLASAPGTVTITSIPTLTIRTYGTLPPAVPYADVILVNKAKAEAYISLQVTTVQGGPTIIEYPVEGTVKIQAPTGFYLYVAWVGGRKMVGEFRLRGNDELTITLFKDRVEIK
jgi:hypothetical protein